MTRELGKQSRQGKALLHDLRDLACRLLKNLDTVDDDAAKQISNELMFQVSQHWGGQSVYIIKDDAFHAEERDIQIYKEFNGHNHTELSKKYKLTEIYIYRIVKRMHEQERNRLQPSLFDA
ncbi:Mor transcription activator family protein [Acinetobacter nematophilus]|uniref:Mor transcription activator domain-containing protein n=1 Tax=Acinetobacter nematophilus TaxID=2994642 RepID=A0A9X3IG76_9GAMM|nr:Mor transcription activator family protein [Acinetobacter nematophilus]MCX5466510.1 hypothetical protein [Acinetobacter nematophilus]